MDLKETYNALYKDGYGESNRFVLICDEMHIIPKSETILDIGCGLGNTVLHLNSLGYKTKGCDIIDLEVTNLPESLYTQIKDYVYPNTDCAVCIDVMEHIPTTEVSKMLQGVFNCCKKVLFTICHVPSYNKGLHGEVLHLTVKPLEWWLEEMTKVGMNVIKYEKYPMKGNSVIIAECV